MKNPAIAISRSIFLGLVVTQLVNPAMAQTISPSSVWDQRDSPGSAIEQSDRFGEAIATGDFNHDGYDDLAVGSPYEDADGATDSGAVFIFYGSADGITGDGSELITQTSVELSMSEEGDLFGWSLATGDFNNDEFDDLAIGTPCEDIGAAVNTGMVAVMFGSANGLIPGNSKSISQTSLFESSNETGDHFGWALAVADFDDNGFDDLAVGTPLENVLSVVDTGMIGIFYWAEEGLLPVSESESISQTSLDAAINEVGDQMGYSLTTGDFDRDGIADLAFGIPYEDAGGINDIGMVGVLFGSDNGLLPATSAVFSQGSLEGSVSETGDRFASSLTSGDFNADGFDDLVVGIQFEDIESKKDTGALGVFFGSRDGLLPADSQTFSQVSADERNNTRDEAGTSLATGDFDGDGYDDLLVGVPLKNTADGANTGTVLAYFGSASKSLTTRTTLIDQSSFGSANQVGNEFGTSMSSGDFDGNHITDLAISAPNDDLEAVTDAGLVAVGSFSDSDGDGLTDLFEENGLGTDPDLADTDGDGTDDGGEYIAGTDPFDLNSHPGISELLYISTTGEVIVTWLSVPDRTYFLEWSSDLSPGRWERLNGGQEIIPGPATTTSFFDNTSTLGIRRRYYRVVTFRP